MREKNWTHVMLGQIVEGPQFQNFTLKCCFLTWRRASENFDRYPKMSHKNVYKLLSLRRGGNVFCNLFKQLKIKNKKFSKSKTILLILGA